MGWFKRATKKVRGAAKTAVGGRTKLGRQVFKAADNVSKKGMGALTVGQISGSDTAKSIEAAKTAAASVAEEQAKAQAALDAKLAADAKAAGQTAGNVALRAKLGLGANTPRPADTGTGVATRNVFTPGARTSWRGGRKPGTVSAVTTGVATVQGGSAADPALLAAQEEEKKKKAALLAAQQAAIPKTTLG